MSPPDAEQALRRLLPRVRNLVRYLVRGDSDVDDIAQQALIAVARGLPTWRGDAPLERWADRVVARATFAELARRRTERGRRADVEALEHAVSPEAAPDDRAIRRQAVAALDTLPEEQRAVIVLHHVVGLSLPEVAAELGVPVETARSRMRLGLGKLRTRVGGEP
jgi:RNA polymerase sigma-70 factor (ECF subfamily)